MWNRMLVSLGCCALAGVVAVVITLPLPAKSPGEKEAGTREAKDAAGPVAVAAPKIKASTSRVTAVTVYTNSALITREVEVPAGAGTVELVVTPLPPQTIRSSLYTEGSDGVRVLATRFRTRQLMEDTREDVRRLQDEIEQLQMAREKLDADVRAVQANIMLLSKLENPAAAVHPADKAAPNSESAIALSKYIMECRTEKSRELVGLQQQAQLNQKKLEFAQRKLNELASGSSRMEQDAVIVVDKANAAAGKVRLNYLVDATSWHPQYKLRAGKTAKDPVQLEYLAAVTQHTGEDWTDIKLVLSTAQPSLNAAPPDLQALQVTVAAPGKPAVARHSEMALQEQVRNLRSMAQKDINEKKQSSGAGLFNTAAALDQSWELLNPDAAVRRGCTFAFREGPSVTYHLNGRQTVPSRNDEQVIEVARLDMQPDYYFKAVPILTQHVYRLADLTNKSNYVLLPGDATMYIDSDFVGQMSMPLVAIGEQFTAGFGIDPQLQISRQMTDRSRTTQGGNQVLRFEYRILVSSYKSEPVKVQVWDRLPHADNDTVGVSLVRNAPAVSKDAIYQREQRPNNLLRWDVSVDPGMSGEKALAINYEFKLELDRQMTIGSFQTVANALPPASPAPAMAPAIPPMAADEAAKIKANLAKLSPEDRRLAEAQVFCALDQDSPLGSMGPILKVMAKGRPVFLCCKGCEKEAKANPDQALAMLDKLLARLNPKK
ncbi:hypothetical protein AYO40_01360 [Planctomycetaceae bacterium SCGC AG-212-D15]|nr:hypothetical protein AYO40_01360 [Planctomycetaceae bacterium SCGC AG-212-D15]